MGRFVQQYLAAGKYLNCGECRLEFTAVSDNYYVFLFKIDRVVPSCGMKYFSIEKFDARDVQLPGLDQLSSRAEKNLALVQE